MVEKHPKTTSENNPCKAENKPAAKAKDSPSKPAAVDRPGLDLGGSTGKTTAGTGLGLGKDAFDNRNERSLPGRRGKDKN